MRVGRRNFRQLRQLILEPSVYRAIPRLFVIHHDPIRVLLDEAFSVITYPWTVTLRTPTGDTKARLYSSADLSTANLVFCRQDYLFPQGARIVVDIGANIGMTSLYWLTRNRETFVECYEPAPRSFQRLLENLAPYFGRFTPHQAAVSDFRGRATLCIDRSGVNSSLEPRKRSVELATVDVMHVNDVLEHAFTRHGRVDVLKLDNEDHEYRTLRAIAAEFWDRIGCVNVGCHQNASALPSCFKMTRVGSAERYVRTGKPQLKVALSS